VKNFSKKLCGLFLLLLLLASPSWGKPVAPNEAAEAVKGWLSIENSPLEEKLGSVSAKVRMYGNASEVFSEGEALYYAIFLQPRGIVFVPADDLVEPILAWQPDAADYDPGENSPFQTLVIADLKGRVEAARNTEAKFRALGTDRGSSEERDKWNRLRAAKNAQDGVSRSSASQGRASSVSDLRVAAFLQSAWDQTAKPALYNYYTPENYVAGCVATSMGQVLRYFKHPQAGIGAKTFSFAVDDKARSGTTRGGDGRGGPYKWDGMPLRPGGAATTAERQNIGALLFDIGISVKSNYTLEETGATIALAFKRLTDTFQYSNAVYGAIASRAKLLPIAPDVLNRMINPNLDAGLPVLLGITGEEGGHAVVTDGYGYSASTLYHHLNMGWGGSDNVWYALPRIDASSFRFGAVNGCVYNLYRTGQGEIVSGRVLDVSGAPVSGAEVTLTGSGFASVTTDSKGIFAFTRLPSNASYTLIAKKTGYVFGRQTVKTERSASPQISNDGGVVVPGSNACGNVWNVALRATSGSSPEPPASNPRGVPVTGLTVSPKTMTLGSGEYYRPVMTVFPPNATNKEITWTTNNKHVVDLVKNSSGQLFLKGMSAGATQVLFKAQGGTDVSAVMTVTVKSNSASTPVGAVPVTAITVSPKTMTLGIGDYYRPTVTFSPSNATEKTVTWTTDNRYVVDFVKESGRIYLKGVGAGTARVTVRAHGGANASASMTVAVKPNAGSRVSGKEEYGLSEDTLDESAVIALSEVIETDSESYGVGCSAGYGLLVLLPAMAVFRVFIRKWSDEA
jgi:hypothetical protein